MTGSEWHEKEMPDGDHGDERGKALGISVERTVRFEYRKESSLEKCWFGGEGFEPVGAWDSYSPVERKAPGSVRLGPPGGKRGKAPPRRFMHTGRRGAPGIAQLPGGGGKVQRVMRRA
jgi:hypothetical protein